MPTKYKREMSRPQISNSIQSITSEHECLCSIRRTSSVEEDLRFASKAEQSDYMGCSFFENPSLPFDFDDCEYGSDCDYSEELSNDNPPEAPPFWFSNEEDSHAKRIVKAYSRRLRIAEPGKEISRFIAPSFIGRIERQPVDQNEDSDTDRTQLFTTLDIVKVYRRDFRQVGSNVQELEENEAILLTTWNDDGEPKEFTQCTRAALSDWERYRKFSKPSYVYCLPVWHNDKEYVYTVGPERKDVGYAKEPFNFTKYIPQHYLISEDNF